jgi:hypothetical protein
MYTEDQSQERMLVLVLFEARLKKKVSHGIRSHSFL